MDKEREAKAIAEKKPAKKKKPNIFQRLGKYLKDVVGELKKVTWPTAKELLSYTGTVIAFILICAVAIGILDFIFSNGFKLLGNISLGAGEESSALSFLGIL